MAHVKSRVKIIMRKMDVEAQKSQLKRDIKMYEFRYETKSEEMLNLISDGKVKETGELVKWMFDYKALRHIEEAPRDSEGKKITPAATDAEVEEYRADLKRNIRDYETFYKMTSEKMLDLLSRGQIPETIEIIKWKFDLSDLRVLEKEIPITGKPTTTTVPSITGD